MIEHLDGTHLYPAYRVKCDSCGASSRYTDRGHVAAWNSRAAPAEDVRAVDEAVGFIK